MQNEEATGLSQEAKWLIKAGIGVGVNGPRDGVRLRSDGGIFGLFCFFFFFFCFWNLSFFMDTV